MSEKQQQQLPGKTGAEAEEHVQDIHEPHAGTFARTIIVAVDQSESSRQPFSLKRAC